MVGIRKNKISLNFVLSFCLHSSSSGVSVIGNIGDVCFHFWFIGHFFLIIVVDLTSCFASV